MKTFFSKNKGYVLLAAMVLGMVVGFIGLDFEQSQIKAKANASTVMMVVGAILFFGSCAVLAFTTWGNKND